MKILITSGGTKVNIDPVRHIGNMSSGTMGKNLALSALNRGHNVKFLTSKTGKTPFTLNVNLEMTSVSLFDSLVQDVKDNYFKFLHKYDESFYETYDDYADMLAFTLEQESYDVIILCAAVSDYGVVYNEEKMRSSDSMSIPLIPTKKLIPEVMRLKGKAKVIGFKLLNNKTVEEITSVCDSYIEKYNLDMMVGNDIYNLRNGGYYNIHVFPNKKPVLHLSNYSDKIIESIESL